MIYLLVSLPETFLRKSKSNSPKLYQEEAKINSDWFRLETMDDSLQPTIDMLLNLSVFMWFGAVCPWSSFLNNSVIPIYRLIFLGILILLVRRLPIVFAMHKGIHQIEQVSQALFVGFFGPIGVGAIFYLSISLEFLREIKVNGEIPEDVQQVIETIQVVVWFLVICSIVSLSNFPQFQFRQPLTNSRLYTVSPSHSERQDTTSLEQFPLQ
jgi:NhaP-type Na+/H+ or K+/H+ antiporter